MNSSDDDNPRAFPSDLNHISRLIADTASDAIVTIDEQGTMLFLNRGCERIFGYSQAELLGQPLTMLVPDSFPHLKLSAGSELTNSRTVELSGLHKSGRTIPLELSLAEFAENGRRFLTGIARDISERKRLERRLASQYQASRILAGADSLRAVAPHLLEGLCESLGWELGQMFMVDRDAEVLSWLASWHTPSLEAGEFERASRTRTFRKGIGLPGRVWSSGESEWISDLAADGNFPRASFAIAAGLRSAFLFPIKLGDQVSGIVELFTRECEAPDQILLDTMAGIGHQIGQFVERKRIEDERSGILDREHTVRQEVDSAIDRMRRVQSVTDSALAHLSLEELLADLLDRVREALRVDTVVILLAEAGTDDLVAWAAKGLEEEVRLGARVPIGTGFAGQVAATKAPVKIDDLATADILNPLLREKGIKVLLGVPLIVEGRVIGVIHVGRLTAHEFTNDDTQLLQLVADRIALAIDNARLFDEERSARREAEAASRAKDEFLTTISHELRTPLTPIIGWVHMMRSGILPGKETEHGLSVVERNSHALKRLINDLLDMSAILSGKIMMEESPVELGSVLREAYETVRPLAGARDIRLDLSFSDWHEEVVVGDRARLVQVFWNLLNNAVKFSTPGGRVHIICTANDDDIVISIEDTGQGISNEFLPFVFERFRQADGSKTRSHGGLGLGLALVKSFVEAHHGTVKAESEGLGRGSRFTVTLPRQPALREVSPAVHQAQVEAPAPGAHLLVVEDDGDTLEVLETTFVARGFRVTKCRSAQEALSAAPKTHIDLVVSDIGMPEMDGIELMKRLRELADYREVPAIALTGYASKKDAESALNAGFNAHVSKPVDPGELVSLIDRLLKPSRTKN